MRSPSYIETLAAEIRSRVAAELVPADSDDLFLFYAALALAKGEKVDGRDVHNAWAAWMTTRDPKHDSIRPYEQLPASVRAEDDPFVAAIRAAAITDT